MKVLSAIFSVAVSLVGFSAGAQVTVDVALDQKQFLPGESLPVTVHVTNRSGQMIHLGEAGWLSFFVQADDGSVVATKKAIPVNGVFDLDSSEVAIKHLDLEPYFALAHTGKYRVTATVHIRDWNSDVTSSPAHFDVIEGAELWSQTFGVPDPAGPNHPPLVRKYTLVEANYLRDQLRLYVQLNDISDGSIMKVRSLGQMISFSQPEAQLDQASDLHVLCQSGASRFTYAIISPNGNIVRSYIYDYVTTRPRLTEDSQGNISVLGGVRRLDPDELPAVKTPDQLR